MNYRKAFLITALAAIVVIAFAACKSSSGKVADSQKENWNTNYTFVFVHGLSGWGHYDAQNKFFPYWGMKNGSLIKKLNKAGFRAYDASVAPQGSAWDRACELYAQLTGSITDYGEEHSKRCGHPRYGRDFSKDPLIPQWDENPEPKSGMQKAMDKANAPKKDGRVDYDYADYDMHIQNADKINSWLTTLPDVYYFSFPCSATILSEDGVQVPIPGKMENLFQRSAVRLGGFEDITPDGIQLGKEWQENDGLVNTISARAPGHSPAMEFSEGQEIKKGLWYIMPTYTGDHMALQGGFSIKNDITDFYLMHLNRINSL